MYSKLHDIAELRRALELLPAAAYVCDRDGTITYFNPHAARMWGREPALGEDGERYCGSARLLTADGRPLPHDRSCMARAIANRRVYLGEEAIVERADGTQVPVLMHATPILDDSGAVTAAVNILVDISQHKRIERLLERANATKDLYRIALADALRSELAPMLEAIRGARDGSRDPDATLRRLQRSVSRMLAVVEELVDSPDRQPPRSSRPEDTPDKPRRRRVARAPRAPAA